MNILVRTDFQTFSAVHGSTESTLRSSRDEPLHYLDGLNILAVRASSSASPPVSHGAALGAALACVFVFCVFKKVAILLMVMMVVAITLVSFSRQRGNCKRL